MSPLAGTRVLVVEDEGAIALLIEEMLEEFGCEVVASVARLAAACEIARSVQVDLAILDVNLAGEYVFPVADILRERQIPFLFSTGYGASGLPAEYAARSVLHKPFSESELQRKIAVTLKEAGESDPATSPDAH
ncbi:MULTISPECIES: response regulator [unclassified Pseudomonas]|uniref:response regulator n=1 Tax=unclassified Pseudomonas TaxID=196821 RepID=UPI00088161CC|nr:MULTISPECIES: response regulator [unclassified Pseudomonas]SCX95281.1 Response regulator receiver domain-containing protein [Pseudomonas sp. NFACC37-1]SFN78134.1 Response regulator receiver domain-containing protein [Pseudomonas sp. NFACC24-1]